MPDDEVEPATLFGLELSGTLPDEAVPTSVIVVVEYIDAEDNCRYLKVMASDMPLWARLGIMRMVQLADEGMAAEGFEEDV